MSVLVAIIAPWIGVLASAWPPSRRFAHRAAPWVPLTLLAPLLVRDRVAWPDVLLGLEFASGAAGGAVVDAVLIVIALAWSAAGAFALRSHRAGASRFWIGWYASLAGMAGVALAATLTAFYLGYVVVSLAAYLLIIDADDDAAHRAGRIYLILALLGEAAVLSGVLITAGEHGNAPLTAFGPDAPTTAFGTPLLLIGFAVKLGIVPLHLWLPLAHGIAPTPASAVLSGVIVKAGLLGWVKLAPPAATEAVAGGTISVVLLAAGLTTAFVGVALGLTQAKLKPLLAYSTVSQMGLVAVAFATAWRSPDAPERSAALLGLLVVHHGLNKASLFLGAGSTPGASPLRLALMALPAASLAAAPLTSGFLAKEGLKAALSDVGLGAVAYGLLPATSVATALLLARALALAARDRTEARPVHPLWVVLTVAGTAVPWAWVVLAGPTAGSPAAASASALWDASWPLVVAAATVAVASRLRLRAPSLPPGDVVVLIEAALRRASRPTSEVAPGTSAARSWSLATVGERSRALERRARELPVAGLILLTVAALLALIVLGLPLRHG